MKARTVLALSIVTGAIALHVQRQKAADYSSDDLTLIYGLRPADAKRLQSAGITTYQQLAAMTPQQIASVTRMTGHPAPVFTKWIQNANDLTVGICSL